MKRPKLQIALDTFDLPSALYPLQQARDHLDIIEVGTILCLAEGMRAVQAIKALFPESPVLADVRIAEAGGIIADMCFDAGADWVTVVSGAAPTTAEVVYKKAAARGGDVQIELSYGWTWEMVERWRDMGIRQVITKRSRDHEIGGGELTWSQEDFETVQRLHEMGYKVTVTGGITPEDIGRFAGVPVEIFIAGRAIYASSDPAGAASAFQQAISATYGGPGARL